MNLALIVINFLLMLMNPSREHIFFQDKNRNIAIKKRFIEFFHQNFECKRMALPLLQSEYSGVHEKFAYHYSHFCYHSPNSDTKAEATAYGVYTVVQNKIYNCEYRVHACSADLTESMWVKLIQLYIHSFNDRYIKSGP